MRARRLPRSSLPTLALGQGPAPKLTESQTSGFPDKAYLVTLPSTQAAHGCAGAGDREHERGHEPRSRPAGRLEERRGPSGRRVEQHEGRADPGRDRRGAGVPRRAQGRSAGRDHRLQPERSTSSREFTTDKRGARRPRSRRRRTTAEGTHIYDAIIEASNMARDAGAGADDRSSCSRTARTSTRATRASPRPSQAADEANVRIISIGLKSDQYDARDAQDARRAARAGATSRPTTRPRSRPIYTEIGQQLSREYEVTYRSLLPPRAEGERPGEGRWATRPLPRPTPRRLSTSRRRERSRRTGSTKSSRRRS